VADHRRAYGQPIPEGFHVHHLCGRNDCTNPDHLIAVSEEDHRKLHRYFCFVHPTSRVILKERPKESYDWFEEMLRSEDAEKAGVVDPFESEES
jgi:hypothetical protein